MLPDAVGVEVGALVGVTAGNGVFPGVGITVGNGVLANVGVTVGNIAPQATAVNPIRMAKLTRIFCLRFATVFSSNQQPGSMYLFALYQRPNPLSQSGHLF